MFSETELLSLEDRVKCLMSEKRFSHTRAVAKMTVRLGELFMPERVPELSCAALLHDVAKELPKEDLKRLMNESDFPFEDEDYLSIGILHSFAGAEVIKRDFPEFATPDVLNSVFYHTVGRGDMTLFEKIIFISDYTEETRKYESCIKVREALLEGLSELSPELRLKRLDNACLSAAEGTVKALIASGQYINSRIYATIKSLSC